MEATIKDHLSGLVKHGATFAGFARLVRWDDNSKGSFVRLALDMFDDDGGLKHTESPFKGCLEGAKDGQKFYLVAIMAPEEQNKFVKAKSLAGQAKMLAQERDFQSYLMTFWKAPCDDIGAEVYIEQTCGVESCSEIIEGTEAATKLKRLQAQYFDWRDR